MHPLLLQQKPINFREIRDGAPSAAEAVSFAAARTYYENTLKDMQGNMLKAHGRPYSALVMFRFGASATANREFMRSWKTEGKITSAWQQLSDQLDFKTRRADPAARVVDETAAQGLAPFGSIIVTATGVTALELAAEMRPSDNAFTSRMEFWQTRENLKDHAPPAGSGDDPWTDDVYQPDIDAIVLLAHEDLAALAGMIGDAWSRAQKFGARIVAIENGFAWQPGGGELREPFGFADGISNPVFTDDGVPATNSPPPGMALADLILDTPAELANGSYVVFRKLEQDYAALEKLEATLARQLAGRVQHDAGEVLIGRDRTGQPLAALRSGDRNDFDFAGDRTAPPQCPFHAHIRKANPRVPIATMMVRRSMIYAERGGPDAAQLEGRRGLLFLAYMSSIFTQFQQLHETWLMGANSQEPGVTGKVGADPLLAPEDPAFGFVHRSGVHVAAPRPRLVIPRGGRYGFVPSLKWLDRL